MNVLLPAPKREVERSAVEFWGFVMYVMLSSYVLTLLSFHQVPYLRSNFEPSLQGTFASHPIHTVAPKACLPPTIFLSYKCQSTRVARAPSRCLSHTSHRLQICVCTAL